MSAGLALRTLSEGHAYPEGPCLSPGGVLHVVELAGGVIARVEGGRRVVARTSGSPNGAAFAHDGSMYFCNNGGNWGPNASTGGVPGLGGAIPRLQVLRSSGAVEDILTEADGASLNGPNDIAIDADGVLWFTDPAWAERDASGSAPASASPPGAVYRVDPGDGAVRRVADGLVFPNGLAITPDGAGVIVGETGTGRLLHYPTTLDADGLAEPTVFAELGVTAYPDGMAFDAEGTLLVAGTGSGLLFVVAPTGDVIDEIEMRDPDVTNVCFAGDDGRTLIITEASTGRVAATRWHAPGMALPGSPSPWTLR